MGKKKRSKFVQQQKYIQHVQSKQDSNTNRQVNRINRKFDKYEDNYNKEVADITKQLIVESGLNPDTIPMNSRILTYELLKKGIEDKMNQLKMYISEHLDDGSDLTEYYSSETLCFDVLKQINWLYHWTEPLAEILGISESEKSEVFEQAKSKLNALPEKKFESMDNIFELVDSLDDTYDKVSIKEDLYKFCKFIVTNDAEFYYTYINNTIKNFKVIGSKDPILEYMFDQYKITPENNVNKEMMSDELQLFARTE